jgi:hypothetical protein
MASLKRWMDDLHFGDVGDCGRHFVSGKGKGKDEEIVGSGKGGGLWISQK